LAPFENGMPGDNKMLKMALERLKQLSAHEVGHTLGLMHNYAASVSDRASVMDYPHPTVSLNAQEKSILVMLMIIRSANGIKLRSLSVIMIFLRAQMKQQH
jgi:hypothetical protein